MKANLVSLCVRLCRKTRGEASLKYVTAAGLAGALIMMVLLSMVGLREYFDRLVRAVTSVIERSAG